MRNTKKEMLFNAPSNREICLGVNGFKVEGLRLLSDINEIGTGTCVCINIPVPLSLQNTDSIIQYGGWRFSFSLKNTPSFFAPSLIYLEAS